MKVDRRKNSRPRFSDLKKYGDIAEYADKVIFIYRDAYYLKDIDEKETAEFIIDKNRNGILLTHKFYFDVSCGEYKEHLC